MTFLANQQKQDHTWSRQAKKRKKKIHQLHHTTRKKKYVNNNGRENGLINNFETMSQDF